MTTIFDIALNIKNRCFGGADTYDLDDIEDAVSDAIHALSLNIDAIDDATMTEIHRHVWVDLTGRAKIEPIGDQCPCGHDQQGGCILSQG